MQFRDRIRELRRVKAKDLIPNPRNWRLHPPEQQKALEAMLADVGFAGALLAREREDGRLELIDGHMRAATTPDQIVPVLVLDVNETEAAKLLATFDRVSGAAQSDFEKLGSILDSVDFHSPAVEALFEGIRQQADELTARTTAKAAKTKPAEARIRPVYQVIVDCRDEAEQREVFEAVRGVGHKCRLIVGG